METLFHSAGTVVPDVGDRVAVRIEGRAEEARLLSVYAGKSMALELEEFDARTRYSQRDGRREKVRT